MFAYLHQKLQKCLSVAQVVAPFQVFTTKNLHRAFKQEQLHLFFPQLDVPCSKPHVIFKANFKGTL